ncbi:peptide-binding protein [Oceaniglobus indicus]|uniref:peptide-binding protein n=1 Tax=Oceaniglobus indicus TaxID=2047749 RepID=UPI0011AB6693|nr:peptide-binding protein [Oceaniglobus indicus]
MIRMLSVITACLWSGALGAQGLPALHDVVGVAENDTPNLRAEPDWKAPLVATLPFDARDIEVVAENADGTWGRINMGEGTAWAALRFLGRQPGQDDRDFPDPLRCFGTEPFWSLKVTADASVFTLSGVSEHRLRQGDRRRATGRTDRWAMVTEAPGVSATMA